MTERQKMRICPGCTGWIEARALSCRHCGHEQKISTPESRAGAKTRRTPTGLAIAWIVVILGVPASLTLQVIESTAGTWFAVAVTSTAISWLLLRSAIVSALRQVRSEG